MTLFTKRGVDIASPVDAAGNKRSVSPGDMQVWLTEAESVMIAFTSNGGLIYDTRANLYADLAHAANSSAWVIADSTVAYNGIYRKAGASGAGSWSRVGDLPYSFITATNAGAGTADAIVATTAIPLPSADGAALITLNITSNNTGAATVAFNGGSALTIKTNSGADLLANYLVSGALVAGVISGSTFRLISDVSGAAYQAAAEAAAADAAAWAAGVSLPAIVAATDKHKMLHVKDDGSGHELVSLSFRTTAKAAETNIEAATTRILINGQPWERIDAAHWALGPDLALATWSTPTGWSQSGETLTKTAGTSNSAFQSNKVTVGKNYMVSLLAGTISASTFTASIGGHSGTARSAAGTYDEVINATSSATIGLVATSTSAGSNLQLVVREMPSYAFQSLDGGWWGLARMAKPTAFYFGAKNDGRDASASGNVTAINNLIAFTYAKGGGVAELGAAGTFKINGKLNLQDFVILAGVHKRATILKLASASNCIMVDALDAGTGNGWAVNYIGGSSPLASRVGCRSAGLMNLSLDGNRAGQSAGSYHGLAYYGVNTILWQVEIEECKGSGWANEAGASIYSANLGSQLQIMVSMLDVHDCDGDIIDYNGPSDSTISHVQSYVVNNTSGPSTLFRVGPKANGLRIVGVDTYGGDPNHLGTTSLRVECSAVGPQVSDCEFERQIHIHSSAAGVTMLTNVNLYTSSPAPGGDVEDHAGIVIQSSSASVQYQGMINTSLYVVHWDGVTSHGRNLFIVDNFETAAGTPTTWWDPAGNAPASTDRAWIKSNNTSVSELRPNAPIEMNGKSVRNIANLGVQSSAGVSTKASAASLSLTTRWTKLTGTTTITALTNGTTSENFEGYLINSNSSSSIDITYNASSLITPGHAATFTLAAGDIVPVLIEQSGIARIGANAA